ncbi:uncharacterized protein A4U43_C02F930 [Asparagus officinalis]|uniref:Uncharacterized protein n=1 Tax=Asparagus officinalis TaxID=4686 RepID=A0A5P1FFK5_ASPOF|nr:uncharacterized protein A4U43_C02F930 [Asparagus officinalis]
MEGLIPYVYKAIVQYRNGGGAPLGGTWFNESPPASYIRLPGGSGRFRASEIRQRSALCTSPPSPGALPGLLSPAGELEVARVIVLPKGIL